MGTNKHEEGVNDFCREPDIPLSPIEVSSDSKHGEICSRQLDPIEGTENMKNNENIVVDVETPTEDPNSKESAIDVVNDEDVGDNQSNVSKSSKKGNRVLEHLKKLFVTKECKKS